ncbi:MAG: hypothetical protein NC431_06115 [Firmicutes bacterium]|nr:hypothetical protein [Bacillota bacterium]
MKDLIRKYRNWRYRRLYQKLFWHFATKDHLSATSAASEAAEAFSWLCGFEYAELFKSLRKPDV